MKIDYKTMMNGGKNISQRDAYAASMSKARKTTKVFGTIPTTSKKYSSKLVKAKLSKQANRMFGK